MDMFVVRGGTPLSGRVEVSGAKNAALPILAASLLAEGPSLLQGIPDLVDVATLADLLRTLGVQVERTESGDLRAEVVDEQHCVADYELVRRMRAGVCVLGPLVARRGRAYVSLPGGCNIGDRPIDLHLKGLRALGADIRVERGYVIAEAPRGLRGANIYLGGPFGSTVTGTCNVMAAAALARGVTTIEAAACEPEVVDLGNYLNGMGARITGLGTPFLRIEGVERLTGTGHAVIPDRIEAATLMIAAAMTRGEVIVENVCLGHMTAVIEKLREIGVTIECVAATDEGGRMKESNVRRTSLSVGMPPTDGQGCPSYKWSVEQGAGSMESDAFAPCSSLHAPCSLSPVRVTRRGELLPADVIALPYPGIPTDVQAQLTALLCEARGISVVTDKVFPDRFMHAPELVRMGADIRREGPSAIINGVPRRSGASVMACDLRASAALVVAALAAQGDSVVKRIYHLDRGYDRLEVKLNGLGAGIRRLRDEPANMPASLVPAVIDGEMLLSGGHASPAAPHFTRNPAGLRPAGADDETIAA